MVFVWQIIFNALAIYITDLIVPNISLARNEWWWYLVAGLILGIINAIIKPLLKVVTLPLRIITLGLFNIVINMALLWLLAQFVPELQIYGFWAFFWAAIILGIINTCFGIGKKVADATNHNK